MLTCSVALVERFDNIPITDIFLGLSRRSASRLTFSYLELFYECTVITFKFAYFANISTSAFKDLRRISNWIYV